MPKPAYLVAACSEIQNPADDERVDRDSAPKFIICASRLRPEKRAYRQCEQCETNKKDDTPCPKGIEYRSLTGARLPLHDVDLCCSKKMTGPSASGVTILTHRI